MQISGGLIASNTVMNLIGQGIPLLVAVITIPLVVDGLGKERFGLLSLAWIFLGAFAIFDLGLGRATTKFISEALGKGDLVNIPPIFWSAVTVQAVFGVIGGIILYWSSPFIIDNVLNIPAYLMAEANIVFNIIALFIPILLITGSFSGVLEAAQRFDYVNMVRMPSNISTYLLPLVGLFLGYGLPGIVALILIAKLACLAALIILNFRLLPGLRTYSISFSHFPRLFSFGGWIMISNILGPIIYYLDRFVIGSLLTMTAITYYTVPYEMASRVSIISGSLAMTLFPAFSSLGIENKDSLQRIYVRSIKYLILFTGPILLILILFANDILRIWVGEDFARQGTLVFQFLIIGYLIAVVHPISGGLFQGLGRPDIVPKLYLAYFPFNIILIWVFVQNMGITGAALFFALRSLIETILYLIISAKFICLPFSSLEENGLWRSLGALLIFGMFLLGASIIDIFAARIGIMAIAAPLFIAFVWYYILDRIDKKFIISAKNKLLPSLENR